MAKLFVYGTLQRGHRLNYVLTEAGATFECAAATINHYSMLFGGQHKGQCGMYPVVLAERRVAPIAGEVYQMPDDFDWSQLDRIEASYTRDVLGFSADGEPTYIYIGKPHLWTRNRDQHTIPHADGIIYWCLPSTNKQE